MNRTLRHAGLLLVVLIIQGCTNSKFIISPLYNRLDNEMSEEFYEMGVDFTDAQVAAFEASVGTFHVWHRQSELAQYAGLMKSIAASAANADTTAEDISSWMDTAEKFSKAARECLPVNFLTSSMRSLSESQIDAIEAHVYKERAENRERYGSRTREERIERRINNSVKWGDRLGIGINATQRAMLLSTFKRQVSLRKEYFALSDAWTLEFFELIRNKTHPDYEADLQAHYANLWQLLESAHPEQWQANRDLWKQTALRFAESLTNEQRSVLSPWLNKMATTLVSIAEDKPSFEVGNDPAVGCLVDSDKT